MKKKVIAVSLDPEILKAVISSNLIFNYATNYYYKNKIEDINGFKLSNSDFASFKSFLNTNKFSYETKTEKALLKAYETAQLEGLSDNIDKDYNVLLSNLNNSKNSAIDENKTYLLELLTDEIVKRYVYREGLYDYYKIHNPEIKKASEILKNKSSYLSYLK